MTDFEEFTHKLKNWQSQTNKRTILNILIAIQSLTNNQPKKLLQVLQQTLKIFHKQTVSAPQQKTDQEWFQQLMKSKKHVQRLINQINDPSLIKWKEYKDIEEIICPEDKLKNKDWTYRLIINCLYKHFFVYLTEKYMKYSDKILEYLDKVALKMMKQFGFASQQKNKDKRQTRHLFDRVQVICKQLNTRSAEMTKHQILNGDLDFKRIAQCDLTAFSSQCLKRQKKNKQLQAKRKG